MHTYVHMDKQQKTMNHLYASMCVHIISRHVCIATTCGETGRTGSSLLPEGSFLIQARHITYNG